jgi:pilus assembly protein CpaE
MSGRAAEPLRALCVSPDGSTAAGVAAMLASLPDFVFATRTAGYAEPLAQAQEVDLAIVVLDEDPAAGLGVIESLRRGSRGTHLVAVSPEDDPDTIVRAVRAGADEHLALPLSQHDLFKICIKVAEVRRGTTARDGRGGALWAVYSPKGGVGVTTLVVNLAIALRAAQRDVALVDLDVYAGDTAFFLNVEATYTLRDVVTNYDRLDAVSIRGAMMRHPSGLSILAAPSVGRGEPLLEPTAEQTIGILELVTGMHELTLVNTARIPSEATRAVLTTADRVLLVTDLTVPALRGCVRTIDWLVGEGVDTARAVEVIVNRYNPRSTEVSIADVSRMIQAPVRALLPCDDAAAMSAANAGRPLAEGTPLHRAIAELVSPGGPPAEASRIRRGLARLFSSSPA